jgi:predicted transcriptional regulator
MPATTIRIRPTTHQALKEIAAATGQSLQDVLEDVIEDRRRKLYLEGVNADYAALNRDPKAATEFKKELEAWDSTNLDGLDD